MCVCAFKAQKTETLFVFTVHFTEGGSSGSFCQSFAIHAQASKSALKQSVILFQCLESSHEVKARAKHGPCFTGEDLIDLR